MVGEKKDCKMKHPYREACKVEKDIDMAAHPHSVHAARRLTKQSEKSTEPNDNEVLKYWEDMVWPIIIEEAKEGESHTWIFTDSGLMADKIKARAELLGYRAEVDYEGDVQISG